MGVGVGLGAAVGVVFGAGGGAGALVPTAVTSSTGAAVTCSPEIVRLISTPPRLRTVQVTVLLPARPAVRNTVLPCSSAPSLTVCLAKGNRTTSVTVVDTSTAVVGVRLGVAEVVGELVVGGRRGTRGGRVRGRRSWRQCCSG